MKQVTYTITFLVDDDVTEDEIDAICATAYVQIDEPEITNPEDDYNVLRFSSEIISSDIEIVSVR